MGAYLLDTHTLLWALAEPRRLGAEATKALQSTESRLYLSMASYWEIAIKISLGKLTLSSGWARRINREMTTLGISWLPISRRHVEGVVELPFHHRDPFDRLLVSQARHEGLAILTRDEAIARYDVECVF